MSHSQKRSTIVQAVARQQRSINFDIAELQRMERQMIPLLNTVRMLQGKPPVIVPTEDRVQSALKEDRG